MTNWNMDEGELRDNIFPIMLFSDGVWSAETLNLSPAPHLIKKRLVKWGRLHQNYNWTWSKDPTATTHVVYRSYVLFHGDYSSVVQKSGRVQNSLSLCPLNIASSSHWAKCWIFLKNKFKKRSKNPEGCLTLAFYHINQNKDCSQNDRLPCLMCTTWTKIIIWYISILIFSSNSLWCILHSQFLFCLCFTKRPRTCVISGYIHTSGEKWVKKKSFLSYNRQYTVFFHPDG